MNLNKDTNVALSDRSVAACCTTLYSHPLASWLLGESLHPGGLALTDRVADLAGIGIDSCVLDAGCGHGSSSLHLAARRGCEVVGVTLESSGVEAARRRAESQGLEDAVTFEQADIQELQFEPGRFDTVLMECVLSTLDRKQDTLNRMHAALPRGGKIALTDVTVSGDLPVELGGVVASALCIGDALSHEEYVELVQSAGFYIATAESVDDVAREFVQRMRTALMMAEAAVGLGKLDVTRDSIRQVRDVVKIAQAAVEDGTLGYSMIVGEKI